MDDSPAGGRMAAYSPGSDLRLSLRELNRRFLALAARAGKDVPPGRLALLSAEQQAAAADCPYALFDVRFDDERHWLPRLQSRGEWQVADASPVDDELVGFAQVALFYAWHVACTVPLRAQLMLGMRGSVAAAFAALPVDRLPAMAATEARHLTVRWHTCEPYWRALIAAAARSEPGVLRRAQLRGIQFAAAARMAPAPIAATGR